LTERYEEDLFLVKGAAGWSAVAALLVALVVLPLVLPSLGLGYLLFIGILTAANVIVAVGLKDKEASVSYLLMNPFTDLMEVGHHAN
jgi:ABC-type molybdate transport system permease subunit